MTVWRILIKMSWDSPNHHRKDSNNSNRQIKITVHQENNEVMQEMIIWRLLNASKNVIKKSNWHVKRENSLKGGLRLKSRKKSKGKKRLRDLRKSDKWRILCSWDSLRCSSALIDRLKMQRYLYSATRHSLFKTLSIFSMSMRMVTSLLTKFPVSSVQTKLNQLMLLVW